MRVLRSEAPTIDHNWGGWVGAYQKKLSTALIAIRDHEHLHKREISRGR
jgi:hypothetical protein